MQLSTAFHSLLASEVRNNEPAACLSYTLTHTKSAELRSQDACAKCASTTGLIRTGICVSCLSALSCMSGMSWQIICNAYLDCFVMCLPLLPHDGYQPAIRAISSCQPWSPSPPCPLPPPGGGHLCLQYCLRGAVHLE